jgi:hypothetical protein
MRLDQVPVDVLGEESVDVVVTRFGVGTAEVINESQTLTGQNPGTATLVSNVVNGPNGPISFSLGNGLSQYDAYDALGRTYANWVCSGAAAFNCSPQLYGFALTAQKGYFCPTPRKGLIGLTVARPPLFLS